MQPLTRRRFLCYSTATGGLATAALLGRHFGYDSSRAAARKGIDAGERTTFSKTSWALGSRVTITLVDRDPQHAERTLVAAFRELETVEQLLSIYRPTSELCRLNRYGELQHPHPYLIEVLQAATEMSRQTEGAFDVTVQPLWSLNEQAKRSGLEPTDAEIAVARRSIDWRNIEISRDRVSLRGEATAITLNGIAQGFAADRVRAVLTAHGITDALVDTGELEAVGNRLDGEGWRVGVQHPRHHDAFASVVQLAGKCLATSGDYATSFTPDRRRHHLFDPHTGHSPTELSSVSVVAPDAMLADALSTSVFVLGAQRGLALVESLPDVDALMIKKDGQTVQTKGFSAIEITTPTGPPSTT